MPTVLRDGPYQVVVYANEPSEPAHVHVLRDDREAKYWLNPISLARNRGFRPIELRRIQRILELHAAYLREVWHELHGH